MVSQVVEDTPAEEIGLERFDVLVRVGDEDINDQSSLVKAIEAAGEAGDKVSLSLIRQGGRQRKRFKPQRVESVNGDEDEEEADEFRSSDPELLEIQSLMEADRARMIERRAQLAGGEAEELLEQASRARRQAARARAQADRAS